MPFSNAAFLNLLPLMHASMRQDAVLSIGLIGAGNVGSALFELLQKMHRPMSVTSGMQIKLAGVMNSKQMLLASNLLELKNVNLKSLLSKATEKTDIYKFMHHLHAMPNAFPVVIDCTASSMVAKNYPIFLKNKLHIITPNKLANAASHSFYRKIRHLAAENQKYYLYEASVCAGLPVVNTLHDLIISGDDIISVEGVLSGTLNYLFYRLRQGVPFSEAVIKAYQQGLTEPDPRIDLSGMDVARKLLTIIRETGLRLELKNITVQNLVPKALRKVALPVFMKKLPEYDDKFKSLLQKNCPSNCVPCYTAEYLRSKPGAIKVGIKYKSIDSHYAKLADADNILILRTQFYDKQPLVIQGPGAGSQVTAAAIMGDIFRLITYLK